MSQTNTNTGGGNTNRNQNATRWGCAKVALAAKAVAVVQAVAETDQLLNIYLMER